MGEVDVDELRQSWNKATGNLLYGEQAMFHTVLTLVEEGKKSNLIWGSDYDSKGVCLVNAAGNTLAVGGGHGIPMASYGTLVSLYDTINREFYKKGINKDNHVSPLAAEILLQWFAPLKEAPEPIQSPTLNEEVYVEPSDSEVMAEFINFLTEPDENMPKDVQTPFDAAQAALKSSDNI